MTARLLARRDFLRAACAGSLVLPGATYGATPWPGLADHGRVRPPIKLPEIRLTLQDGSQTSLSALAEGHSTAVQLMFPACTTTCPLGAATFGQVQDLLPDQGARRIRLLSLNIAPFGDGPETLRAWLDRFGARPGWLAASPDAAGLSIVQEMFDDGRDFSEGHSDRVNLVNRFGQLAWRSYELPSAEDIVALLTHV